MKRPACDFMPVLFCHVIALFLVIIYCFFSIQLLLSLCYSQDLVFCWDYFLETYSSSSFTIQILLCHFLILNMSFYCKGFIGESVREVAKDKKVRKFNRGMTDT